jgi:PadR family transcriptional regulator, regulatory protein PadR
MRRPRRPSPQTLAVLLALAQKPEEWSYGYDLCRSLGLKAGTVYPLLIRLAERGHVVTAWEEAPPRGRPARHLYRISPEGAEYVRELRLEAAADAVKRRDAALPRPAGGAIAGAAL